MDGVFFLVLLLLGLELNIFGFIVDFFGYSVFRRQQLWNY